VMIRRSQVFGARQPAYESGGIVNQHRQMLRADPEVCTAIVEMDERDVRVGAVARNAGTRGIGHGTP
jgi:hypothetical protein